MRRHPNGDVVQRYPALDGTLLAAQRFIDSEAVKAEVLEDFSDRIKRGVLTSVTEPAELEAQKWFIASFLDDGFRLRRFHYSDAAVAVFGLSHAWSRQLFDLTALEVRRIFLGAYRPKRIEPKD